MNILSTIPQIKALFPERQQVTEFLNAHYEWSPHDFIRDAAFISADRALYFEHLSRPLPAENDLRVLIEVAGQRYAIFAEILPWDTAFFGYTVARLNGLFPLEIPVYRPKEDFSGVMAVFMAWLVARDIKYLFAPADPRDLAFIRALTTVGFQLIETRCIYHRSLIDYHTLERYDCRVATPEDVPSLVQTAQMMVNPFDRFHADPFIKIADADRLMCKWIQASILEKFADVTIVPNVSNPAAFCTVKYHQSQWNNWGVNLAQSVVLAAVSPKFKGWYRKIISEISYHLVNIGATHCFMGTQLTNGAAIASFERAGFSFGKGEHIFRILL